MERFCVCRGGPGALFSLPCHYLRLAVDLAATTQEPNPYLWLGFKQGHSLA
jgi:hypothetical protein